MDTGFVVNGVEATGLYGVAFVAVAEHVDVDDCVLNLDVEDVTDNVAGHVAHAPVVLVDVAVGIVTKVAHAFVYGCIGPYSDRNDGIGFLVHLRLVGNLVDGDAAVVDVAGDVACGVAYCCRQHLAFYAVVAVVADADAYEASAAGVKEIVVVGFGDCTVVQVDFQY